MKKIIIFNWKMNVADFIRVDKNNKIKIVICPPFTHLEKVKNSLSSKIKLGAQNCFYENEGAYTGEISPTMLKNLGVEYVIIGHSERRRYLDETDEMINKKVLAALKAGLKVVLCIGEDLAVRKRGPRAVKNYVKNQLEKDLKGIKSLVISHKSLVRNLVIAYEPVWAIGTGNPCCPEDALEMIKFIKKFLSVKCQVSNVKVLYGGSVNGKNIKNFVKYPEIDGALVGGASLKIKEVKKIISIIK
jgi:triosephosphate isomerase